MKFGAEFAHWRSLLKFCVYPILSIALYLLFIQTVWHTIGDNPAFGLVTWTFIYWIFPYWFAKLSNSVKCTKQKRIAAFVVYALLILITVYFGEWINVHATGYLDRYLKNPEAPEANESIGIIPLIRTFECAIAFILYIVYYIRRRRLLIDSDH